MEFFVHLRKLSGHNRKNKRTEWENMILKEVNS